MFTTKAAEDQKIPSASKKLDDSSSMLNMQRIFHGFYDTAQAVLFSHSPAIISGSRTNCPAPHELSTHRGLSVFNGNFEDSLANSVPEGWRPHPELFDSVVEAIDTLNHREKLMYRGIILMMLSCFDGNSLSIEKLVILYAKLESGLDETVATDQESDSRDES